MDLGRIIFSIVLKLILLEIELLSLFVDIMPEWRGRSRPRRIPMEEETVSVPHASPPHGDPLVPPEFLIP